MQNRNFQMIETNGIHLRTVVEGNGLFGLGCSIGRAGAVVRLGDSVTVHTTAPPVLSMG